MTLAASIASLLGEETVLVRIVGAVLIIITGFVIGHLAGILLRRFLRELRLDAGVRRFYKRPVLLERTLGTGLSIVLYTTTIIIALSYLHLTKKVLLAALAIIGLLMVISLLLSLKDLLPNAWGGITIIYRRSLRKGDRISIRGVQGYVMHRGVSTTTVQDGHDRIIIPNRLFLRESHMTTRPAKSRRTSESKKTSRRQ